MQCAPGEPSYLVSIEEVSTCKYLVHFSSNLLCKHPAFAADKKKEVLHLVRVRVRGRVRVRVRVTVRVRG